MFGGARKEVFALVLGEALVVGLAGGILGVGLGVLLGQGAVQLVTQTINDLFFVIDVRGIQIPVISLLKGAFLGVGATLLAAAPPAWEAASVPPRLALSRSGLENKARQAVSFAATLGLISVLGGWAVLSIPNSNLVISFVGTLVILIGCALFVPFAVHVLMHLAAEPLGRLVGTLGRMAPRNVSGALSRTAIAVMALMVAVSVTIGVSLMVSSFRGTVVAWLAETLQGDVYISVPGLTATTPTARLEPSVIPVLREWPGVARLDVLRSVHVNSPQGEVYIAATDNFTVGSERVFLTLDVSPAEIWSRMLAGAVIISEPLANRLDLPRRDAMLNLFTANGLREFSVIGVYYDYASTEGSVLMALPLYRSSWHDPEITAIALRLKPGFDVDEVVTDLRTRLASEQQLLVQANQSLRQEVLRVFDRTFAITGALQLLATIVAFIGVLSALLSLELERQRELGILRSLGMTVRQIWALIFMETGLMGFVAGLLAMPTGYLLALILVYIINRRSFGWTLQMQVDPLPFFQALIVAVIAALVAGLYPAFRMGRLTASEAFRSE